MSDERFPPDVLRRRRLIAAVILSGAAGLYLVTKGCSGHQPLLQTFANAYAAGDMKALPLDEESSRDAYAVLFATSKVRGLELRNVHWGDAGRLTATYYANVDGAETCGSVTMWIEQERITRIVHDLTVWPESDALADAGQVADKASTLAGIASHTLTEANPLLNGAGPVGIAGAGLAAIALRQTIVRDMPLTECIEASRWLSALGWGTAANNLLAMTGVGLPLAPVVGFIAGAIAWQASSGAGDCVDGPVRIATLRSAS